MTENNGPPRAGATNASPPSTRSRGWWSVLVPAAALLVGLVIGALVVGVADDADAPSTRTQPSNSPTVGDRGQSSEGADTTVVVPAECLAAVDTVAEATQLTREGAGAIRDFDPQQLRSLLRELEALDERAREQAQACREVGVEQSPAQE